MEKVEGVNFEVFAEKDLSRDVINFDLGYLSNKMHEFCRDNGIALGDQGILKDFFAVEKSQPDYLGCCIKVDDTSYLIDRFYHTVSDRIHLDELTLRANRKEDRSLVARNIRKEVSSCIYSIMRSIQADIISLYRSVGGNLSGAHVIFGIPAIDMRPRKAHTWYFGESSQYSQLVLTNGNNLHFLLTQEVFNWDLVFTVEAIVGIW